MKIRIKGTFVWMDVVSYTDVNHTHMVLRDELGDIRVFPIEELTHLGVYESLKQKATKFMYKYFSTNMLGIDWAKIKKSWKSK